MRRCRGRWRTPRSPGSADPVLGQPPAPVAHLGIDEHRRGRPRWRTDADTGEYVLLADRWHTCFFDLSGDQGLLGQVEGRTADDAAYWLAQAPPAWRDAIEVVAIDMCSIYASAVRRMLPAAQLVVDLFHVVQLAVKMTGDVRRRVVRARYGRRGRSGDAEYGVKSLLVRNLEHLRPEQFAKVMDTLGARPARPGDPGRLDREGEAPRRAEPAGPRHRLRPRASGTSAAGCSASTTGARRTTTSPSCSPWPGRSPGGRTRSSRAVLTGVTNARSEALNRLAKLEARMAYSFRNPANQRRRVRIACTRGARRSRAVTPRRSRLVTGRKPDPG